VGERRAHGRNRGDDFRFGRIEQPSLAARDLLDVGRIPTQVDGSERGVDEAAEPEATWACTAIDRSLVDRHAWLERRRETLRGERHLLRDQGRYRRVGERQPAFRDPGRVVRFALDVAAGVLVGLEDLLLAQTASEVLRELERMRVPPHDLVGTQAWRVETGRDRVIGHPVREPRALDDAVIPEGGAVRCAARCSLHVVGGVDDIGECIEPQTFEGLVADDGNDEHVARACDGDVREALDLFAVTIDHFLLVLAQLRGHAAGERLEPDAARAVDVAAWLVGR